MVALKVAPIFQFVSGEWRLTYADIISCGKHVILGNRNHGLLAATKTLFCRRGRRRGSSTMLRDKVHYRVAGSVYFYSSTRHIMRYFFNQGMAIPCFNCNNTPPL